MIFEKAGSKEIGRKSDGESGFNTFGRGLIKANFHLQGNVQLSITLLTMSVMKGAIILTPISINIELMLSTPIAFVLMLFMTFITSGSETKLNLKQGGNAFFKIFCMFSSNFF